MAGKKAGCRLLKSKIRSSLEDDDGLPIE